MIGVPEARPPKALHAPIAQQARPPGRRRPLDASPFGDRIQTARCANPLIAFEHLISQVTGVRAEAPFADTPIGAEGPASGRNLELTPAAERPAVCATRQFRGVGTAALHRAILAQGPRVKRRHVESTSVKPRQVLIKFG